MALHRNDKILAVILAIFAVFAVWYLAGSAPIGTRYNPLADPKASKLGTVWVGQTANYQVTSWATVEQTTQVGSTVEALLRAYLDFFKLDDKAIPKGGLKLTLYRSRAQFKEKHPGLKWPEASYERGVTYAYVEPHEPHNTDWMLREATRQLNAQVAHTAQETWIDEGLAAYFSASSLEDYTLTPGRINPKAYPVQWLRRIGPSGDMQKDLTSGRLVPLRTLVSGQGGPNVDDINRWYLGWWSLTHFLLHGEGGKYAEGFHRLARSKSATLADFEREIGPVDAVQAEWYRYLQGLAGQSPDGQVIVVD
jgi:hypothetical protein